MKTTCVAVLTFLVVCAVQAEDVPGVCILSVVVSGRACELVRVHVSIVSVCTCMCVHVCECICVRVRGIHVNASCLIAKVLCTHVRRCNIIQRKCDKCSLSVKLS